MNVNPVTNAPEEELVTLAEVQARIEAKPKAIEWAISKLDDEISEITAEVWAKLWSDRGQNMPDYDRGYDYVQNMVVTKYMEHFRK